MPSVDNVSIAESPYDPGWVGQPQGDLVNGDKIQTLARATLSAVVFDLGRERDRWRAGFHLHVAPRRHPAVALTARLELGEPSKAASLQAKQGVLDSVVFEVHTPAS